MRRALPIAVCLLLVGGVPADAQRVTAPPGNAGVDEYVESVPAATGNRPTQRPGGGSRGNADSRTSGLNADQVRALRAQGADGEALAQVLANSGPAAGSQRSPSSGSGTPAARSDARSTHGESPVESVIGAATSGSGEGLGPALPILLAATLGLFLGAALMRRRQHR